MPRFSRSAGLTASERYLGSLADRSFLNLWSYPNVSIDKFGDAKRGSGKELCDLLVVCGSHVIVFSDKTIGWPVGGDLELSWKRWSRRAIDKSIEQVLGAKRWLLEHPDRIFLDKECTVPFPIPVPDREQMSFHGIVVALGAGAACRRYFGEGSGSLIIAGPDLLPRPGPVAPFTVTAPADPAKFVHVLDDVALDVVLRELDTVTDFTSYLAKKEAFLRDGHLAFAHGEEELLAWYLTHINQQGEHDFVFESGSSPRPDKALALEGGHYAAMRKDPKYIRKKQADRISYGWDRLIEAFTGNIIAGTTVVPEGFEQLVDATSFERGVRELALVPRLLRRSHSEAIRGAFESIRGRDRFFRAMMPGPTEQDQSVAFFLLLVRRGGMLADKTYAEYRTFRSRLAYAYALNMLRRHPALERIVGIATEGDSGKGSSEDLIFAAQPEWTPETIKQADELREGFEIMREPFQFVAHRPLEYPDPSAGIRGPIEDIPYGYAERPKALAGNRKARRSAAARARAKK